VHARVVIGLLLALACAAGASLGGLWKQKGAVQSRDVDIRHPVQTAVALFRSRWFALGWLVAVLAWLLHVGALALAPLSLAQAVISGGLVTLGLIAERFFGFKLSRRQWFGMIILGLGMAVLAVTAHNENDHSSYGIPAIIGFDVVCLGLGVGCAFGHRVEALRQHHGLMLAIASGIMFGVSDVSIKALTSGQHGVLGIVGPWTLAGLVAGLAAFYASARSLQVGEAVAVIAATATAANLLGIAGGVIVFGDPLGKDAPTVIGRLLAFVLVLFAVSLMPAPVRAQEAAREQAENDQAETETGDAEREGATDRDGATEREGAAERKPRVGVAVEVSQV
jgi:drug/metabolite transporter (DMT)-like permease